MKYIIADPDMQNGIDLKNILDDYETLDFQGSYATFKAAENCICEDPPGIAFILLGKAEMNAFRLAVELKEISPLSKVVFVSSNAEYAVEAFECGVDGFLFIPFDKKKIEHFLLRWLEK